MNNQKRQDGSLDEESGLIVWDGGEGYALAKFAEGGQYFELPCHEEIISGDTMLDELDVLVFSERSGGGKEFMNWYRNFLDRKRIPWIHVVANQWQKDNIVRSKGLRESYVDLVERFGREPNPAEKAKCLQELASSVVGGKIHLIIRDFMGLGSEEASAAAAALRHFRDRESNDNLQILIASTAEIAFLETNIKSRYNATCFRLPHFTQEEIRILANSPHHGQQLSLNGPILRQVMDITGGQPLLVHQIFKILRGLCKETKVNKKHIDRALKKLIKSPPAVAPLWQDNLEEILREEPNLIDVVKKYASDKTIGPSYFPPSILERFLLIAGWVKLNERGRWGMTGLIHQVLAPSVLDRMGRLT